MDFRLSPTSPEDLLFLEELFHDVRTPEYAPLGLPAAALHQLLGMQLAAQRSGYATQFPHALDRIVWVGTERAGRVLVDRNAGGMQLVDIALLERFRSKGIGTKLLRDLSAEADAAGITIGLTVRLDNPAERLYRRAGFVRTASDGLYRTMVRSGSGHPVVNEQSGIAVADDSSAVVPGLNSRYFQSMLGTSFVARSLADGTSDGTVVLLLESVLPLRAASSPRHAGKDFGDSFTLIFTGPADHQLPGALTEMVPEGVRGQVSLQIFLSPVGMRDGRVEYEAIFNRASY